MKLPGLIFCKTLWSLQKIFKKTFFFEVLKKNYSECHSPYLVHFTLFAPSPPRRSAENFCEDLTSIFSDAISQRNFSSENVIVTPFIIKLTLTTSASPHPQGNSLPQLENNSEGCCQYPLDHSKMMPGTGRVLSIYDSLKYLKSQSAEWMVIHKRH